MNLRLIILSLGLTACIGHSSARAGLSLGDLSSSLKGDSASNDITKIKKDAVEKKGLFTTLFNEKTGKLYLSIPEECLGKEYLLSSRIVATSDGQDYSAGEVHTRPMMIAFSTDTRNVFMHQVQNLNTVVGSDPIKPAFDRSNMNPVMKGFKIAARDGRNLVIDVTAFFGTNEKSISPMKDTGVLGKLLGSDSKLKGTFQSEASGIAEVKTFEKNIEIKSLLSYQITGALPKPYSVMVQRSLFALPENPMPMRLQDNRVGYFQTDKNIFSSNADRIAQKAYIERWRIEPKTEDLDKYFAGEMVEPQKQIVFYVDTAFPAKWRQTIREGIEVWNKAFEAAGFKNVVKAMDYPTDDDAFDPDNMQYNCFRYVATNTANAMGPSYVDPRTGEILAADVIWYHNIISLLHNWRFVQTGAVDKRVRKIKFDDDVMLESIKYAASHEVGHTLGLMHNMGASYAFPVEKLRDPQFTQKYGTTPSIMDYARNNYIAQPGDVERGVKLTPPEIGVYDIHAINWGYRIIKGISTPEEEKDTLCKWIEAKANDEMYEFGAQQLLGTIDPTDQTEDLGNDHIKASDYGISNMKILVENFDNWLMEKNE
ncbi:MAG: zinc-dependent metalloprotease, partial [Prevotellaceae bacterium]|nr:zinc-dependent metalloprotease [Prevotellaceae bacterium]